MTKEQDPFSCLRPSRYDVLRDPQAREWWTTNSPDASATDIMIRRLNAAFYMADRPNGVTTRELARVLQVSRYAARRLLITLGKLGHVECSLVSTKHRWFTARSPIPAASAKKE